MATAIIAQSGGPTPVINASLFGAVMEARDRNTFTKFLGARNGLQGMLENRFVDLFAEGLPTMERVRIAPGAALGSSRLRMTGPDMDRLLDVLRKNDVHYFFYIGGNGSMGTALDIERAARAARYELYVIGVPKTVDNDLYGTDHTPGYGSAARFYAHAIRDMGMDHWALPSPVLICEVIGRHVGWLAAATAFARSREDDAPHLIYFPERPLARQTLLADIENAYRIWGRAFVCICEGQLDENGEPFGADLDRPEDPHHCLATNLAHAVAQFVNKELNLRTRSERPSLLARSSSAYVSERDRTEAELVGKAAIHAALSGVSGQMVGLARDTGSEYHCETVLEPLEEVAWRERPLPASFADYERRFVTEAYLQYALPLIGNIESHPRF
jgi:6-phosphofructokinase 1